MDVGCLWDLSFSLPPPIASLASDSLSRDPPADTRYFQKNLQHFPESRVFGRLPIELLIIHISYRCSGRDVLGKDSVKPSAICNEAANGVANLVKNTLCVRSVVQFQIGVSFLGEF